MAFNFARFLMAFLTVSNTLVLTNELGRSQTKPARNTDATTFQCVRQGSGYATIAQRGNRRTSPIITWNSTAFGPQYPPQIRCQEVSKRLTKAVAASGGRLSKLKITYGEVNSSPVICYITDQEEKCNSQNLLLTLNQSDRGKEAEILNQMRAFSVNGTTPGLVRGENGKTIITIGDAVEKDLEGNGSTAPSSMSGTQLERPVLPAPSTAPPVDNSL